MYMLFENTNIQKNGINQLEDDVKKRKSKRIWIERLSREWIFSLIVFLLLLLIVIEKIYFSYVLLMSNHVDDVYNKSDIEITTNLYDFLKLSNIVNLTESVTQHVIITGEPFINTVYYYNTVLYDRLKMLDIRNQSLIITPILYGILITIVNWLIIYMDSRIPGYDPPFPFNLLRKGNYRIQITTPINLNYFIGALIGLLVTIFMLLETYLI